MSSCADLYDIGDRPTLVATFYDINETLADPEAITFSLLAPDGTVTEGDETDATSPSVGVWHWQIPAAFDQPGWWAFRAAATAGLETAAETHIEVRPSSFP
jgi:hypothetical protein